MQAHPVILFLLFVLGSASFLYGTGTTAVASAEKKDEAVAYGWYVGMAGGAGALAFAIGLAMTWEPSITAMRGLSGPDLRYAKIRVLPPKREDAGGGAYAVPQALAKPAEYKANLKVNSEPAMIQLVGTTLYVMLPYEFNKANRKIVAEGSFDQIGSTPDGGAPLHFFIKSHASNAAEINLNQNVSSDRQAKLDHFIDIRLDGAQDIEKTTSVRPASAAEQGLELKIDAL